MRYDQIPGPIRCRKALNRLSRFQDLVRHHHGISSQIALARPLEELINGSPKSPEHREVIQREINRLVPLISSDLHLAGIPTGATYTETSSDYSFEKGHHEKVTTKKHFDLLENYFELPRSSSLTSSRLIMAALEPGIGVYRDWEKRARVRLLNPFYWLALALRLPLLVLEMANLADDATASQLRTAYAWLIRALILLLLALGATKLGISIPWSSLLK